MVLYLDNIFGHFSRAEFACRCGCGFSAVDAELLFILNDVRDMFGRTIVSSGCRCKTHNRVIGGDESSYHMLGMASDIIPRVSVADVYAYIDGKYPEKYGMILYPRWIHVDVRPDWHRERRV